MAENKKNLSEKSFLKMKVDDFENKFNLDDFTRYRETNMMALEDITLKDELIGQLRDRMGLIDTKHNRLCIKYDNLMRGE